MNRIESLAGPAWISVPRLSALSIIGLSMTCTKSALRLASDRYTRDDRPDDRLARPGPGRWSARHREQVRAAASDLSRLTRAPPPAPRTPPADRLDDEPRLPHQPLELLGVEALRAVGQRAIGVGMDLDQQPVGAGGDRGARHRDHHVAVPGAVARIGHDRQVREPVHHGNRAQVEQIAGGGVEAADAALAENHVGVPLGEDVLRGEQQLLDRRGEAALEEHRLAARGRRA